MISYHEAVDLTGKSYAHRWKTARITTPAEVADYISNFAWSPIVWCYGERRESSFQESHWCALDFETPEFTMAEAVKTFCDSLHVIGTTKSHGTEKAGGVDRFRVVLAWEKPVASLETYRDLMYSMTKRYPVDRLCKDGARFFYPCKTIVSVNNDMDAYYEDIVPRFTVPKMSDETVAMAKKLVPHFVTQLLTSMVPGGQRNTACFKISLYLTLAGVAESEILRKILASPTYAGKPAPIEEIKAAIRSGKRRALRELEGSQH